MQRGDPLVQAQGRRGLLPHWGTGGIQAKHAGRLRLQLGRLNRSSGPHDMAAPNWHLHPLKGRQAGRWSVWVDSHWRPTFAFERGDAVLVDYEQYH